MHRGWLAVVLLYGCVSSGPDGARPDGGGCRGASFETDDTSALTCPTDLILTEVMSSPGAGADFEWLEIQNVGGDPVLLDGLEIVREGSDATVYGSDIELQPGAYAVLARGQEPSVPSDYIYEGLTLTDSTASLCLFCGGEQIDCIEYGDTSKGTSWSLDPGQLDESSNDNPAAWCPGAVEMANGDLGSPGQENPACPIVLQCPDSADLVVTEVFPRIIGSEGEFIEVMNLGSEAVPLNCIRALDGGTERELVDCEGTLAPGDLLVMAREPDWHLDSPSQVCGVKSMTMTDGGEVWGVALETLDGSVITLHELDCVEQDCPYALGVSAHVDPREVGESDVAFWCESGDSWGEQLATPGWEGGLCDLPVDADGDGYYTPDDCDDSDKDIYPGAPDSYGDGVDQDCDGADGAALVLSDLGLGDLLITEAMPDPDAVLDTTGEWVELYNPGTQPISLDGLQEPCSLSGAVAIGPGEHLVLAKKDDAGLNGGIDGAVQCSLSLTNGGKTLTVGDGGVALDTFEYSSARSGKSIQRSFDGVYDGAAMCDGVLEYGDGDLGTPGAFNGTCD